MARRRRELQIRSLTSGKVLEVVHGDASAARAAARAARGGSAVEVFDVAYNWSAMRCEPRRHGRKTIARCTVKEPFRRRIKFRGRPGLAGLRKGSR